LIGEVLNKVLNLKNPPIAFSFFTVPYQAQLFFQPSRISCFLSSPLCSFARVCVCFGLFATSLSFSIWLARGLWYVLATALLAVADKIMNPTRRGKGIRHPTGGGTVFGLVVGGGVLSGSLGGKDVALDSGLGRDEGYTSSGENNPSAVLNRH
jgi:hypothetical protein